ncbi:MAG: PocR ligand-binding domain-containing protein [Byssovorax sp.]
MTDFARPARPYQPFTMAGVDGEPPRLEELVDRRALTEMILSFELLFGVPIRILAVSGATLAGASAFAPLCALVNASDAGQQACAAVLSEVHRVMLPRGCPGRVPNRHRHPATLRRTPTPRRLSRSR